MELEIFYCNKTYNKKWLDDKKNSNGIQYKIITVILELIKINRGGSISQQDVLDFDPAVKEYVERRAFRVIPSSGTEMTGNGRGIQHAKYSPTKSVAIIWSVVKDKIHVTFDDHAPRKYHRAIYSFHQLRLGKPIFPMKSKCSRKMREILNSATPWIYRGIDPRDRYYYSK